MNKKNIIHFDCIVIGKGAIGLSSTLHLLETGLRVLCIDDKNLNEINASHASGAMLGAITELSSMNLSTEEEESTFIEARKYHDVFRKKLLSSYGKSYKIKNGVFVIADIYKGNNDSLELEHQIGICEKYDLKYDEVELSQVPGYEPLIRTGREKAIYFNFDGSIDSSEFLICIENAISKFPSIKKLFKKAKVSRVKRIQENYIVECKNGETFSSKNVLFTTGAFSQKLIRPFLSIGNKNMSVLAGRGTSVKVSELKTLTYCIRTPNRDFACGLHLVPNNNSTYIGATNRVKPTHNIDNKLPFVNEIQSLFNSAVNELNRNIKQLSYLNSKVGYRPLYLDRRPMVGEVGEGIWVANGTYRNGILLSPLIGKEISIAISKKIKPRTYWNTNRECISEFNQSFNLKNENWVKNVKKEMYCHVFLNKEVFNKKLGSRYSSIEGFCNYIYNNVLIKTTNELIDESIDDIKKEFQKAPIRENIPNVLNLLLSKGI